MDYMGVANLVELLLTEKPIYIENINYLLGSTRNYSRNGKDVVVFV